MPKKKKHPKRHRPKPRSAPASSTAIVPALPPQTIVQGNRTRTLKREEIELLKKTVAKGTSDKVQSNSRNGNQVSGTPCAAGRPSTSKKQR